MDKKYISTPRTSALRAERIKANVCVRCGGWKEMDSQFCTFHKLQHRAYLLRYAAKKLGRKMPPLKPLTPDLKYGTSGHAPRAKDLRQQGARKVQPSPVRHDATGPLRAQRRGRRAQARSHA